MTFVLCVGMLIVAVVVAILAAKERDLLPFALSLVGTLTLGGVLLVELIALALQRGPQPGEPHPGVQTLPCANPDSLHVDKAAYGDWKSDAPGLRRHIRSSDLPAPYDSSSTAINAVVVPKPTDARLNVPSGFQVKPFASGLDQPRLIRVAPNGDIFIA